MANYIVRSPGRHVLHVRIVVPRDLRASIGKRELRRSLRTADPILGRLRALQVAHRITSVFRAMKRSKDNPATMKALIVCLAEGTVRLEDPYTARDVDEAIRIARELGTAAPAPAKQQGASQAKPSHLPLSDLWKIYAAEQTAVEGWTAKTVVDMHGPVKRYEAWCARNALNPYDKLAAAKYKADSLLRDSTKRGTRLKPETVNQHIDRLSAMFRWAIDNGKASIDPFHKLKVRIGAKARAAKGKPRPPYTYAEIEKVLTALDPTKDERHWLPLLGMFTGARINELAQLHIADIMREPGIELLHINEDEPNTRVKNHRRRKVPMHEELIRRGFLKYVEQLRKRGEKRIFPKLTHGRDGYGQSASKWYNRTFRKHAGISKDFHTYRHTVQAALDGAGVHERVINAILGHAAGKSMSMTTYEHGLPLRVLQGAINKLPANPGRQV